MSPDQSSFHLAAGDLGSDDACREADLKMLYQLVLGREPESADTVAAMLAFPYDHLPSILFSSQETRDRIDGLRRGQDPWRGAGIPGRELAEWAALRLPLSANGRDRVALAGWSWPALFLALASDEVFIKTSGASVLSDIEIVSILTDRSRSRGMIEGVADDIVVGWALPDEVADGSLPTPAALELWLDGVFVGATLADRFRRDIQDQIGGDGRVGFVFDLVGRQSAGGEALIEVRRASCGASVGFRRVSLALPQVDAIAALQAEIAKLRKSLDRLERSLPVTLATAGGTGLQDWDAYVQAWYSGLKAERTESLRWAVIIDAADADPKHVQQTLAAVGDQLTPQERILLIASVDNAGLAKDIARRTNLLGECEVVVVETVATDGAERLKVALPRATGCDLTLLLQAGDVLHPATLALMTPCFVNQPTLRALYVDEDRLDASVSDEERPARHVDPVLKPGPDPDLLMQTPYVGRSLAFRTSALDRGPFTLGLDGWHGPALVQHWSNVPGAVGHLALVLVTQIAPPEDPRQVQSAWRKAITAALSGKDNKVELLPHEDILGAVQSHALKIRRPVPAGTRATVIIPTRDRLDLLKPCIDSLEVHREHNRTRMDLIVVDHESTEPETTRYLASLKRNGARIIPHKGPFNWALMNNVAAAEAQGDILVFLNNDTLVLSPDWLDVLVAQALREDVGVVGCRLLYGDGTLQHAGFVARGDAPGFLTHDGVGVAGRDGGYLGRHALAHASPVVTGACLAVSRLVFEALGTFDAACFPVEGNDADLCFRARAAGFRVLYEPGATLYHLESKSRGVSVTGEKLEAAIAAERALRTRWADRFADDPGFNPHFARSGSPFARLRPPTWSSTASVDG